MKHAGPALAARLVRLISAGALATGLTVALGLAGHAAMAAAAPVDTTTTTTAPPTTTTTVPPTTTTTTTVPPTTTSTVPATTTTSTTTTTLPTQVVPSSTTPWGLIALIVVLVALIGLVVMLMVSRNRRSALDAWRRRTLPALSDAKLAREALLSATAVSDDAELRGAVAVQVDRASIALEQGAASAPDPAAAGTATAAAGSLRGLAFAIEADRLLRHGAAAPTGVQLAQADQARRERDAELQGALSRLQAHVVPPDHRG